MIQTVIKNPTVKAPIEASQLHYHLHEAVDLRSQDLILTLCNPTKGSYCHMLVFSRYEVSNEVLTQICARINTKVRLRFELEPC